MRLKHFNLQLGTQILKSFSDESRIRIMHLLYKNKEMCISDIEIVLNFTQTKTSRHLIYLKNAGLVTFRRVDQWTYYAIKEEVAGFVEYLYSYLDKDLQLQKDVDMYQTLYNNKQLAVCKLRSQGDWEFQY